MACGSLKSQYGVSGGFGWFRKDLTRCVRVASITDMTTEITRKNRKTGSTIIVRQDDFLGWITVCATHYGWAEHSNKSAALAWSADPTVWCEGCEAK